MDLQTQVSEVSRAYKMYKSRLATLGIFKLEDFLFHIPFRYDDFSLISNIANVQPGETVTIHGQITEIKNQYTRKWKSIQKAKVKDKTGEIEIIWFNQSFIPKTIQKGDLVSLSGKVDVFKNKPVMQSPDYEVIFNNQTIHTGRLVPIYSETRGISSKWLRRQIFKLLEEKNQIKEFLPQSLIAENNFLSLSDAIEKIHFPKDLNEAKRARERLSFDELFELQLSALVRKKAWEKYIIKKPWQNFEEKVNEFIEKLPFELTNAQKEAVEEILKELTSQKPMNRLLEGEVGSGKTVVAAIAMYLAFLNGVQSAFMAPTEILANQHYKTIRQLLSPFGVKVGLATGSSKNYESRVKKKDHNSNFVLHDSDVIVGTHALISSKVKFENLGFVVIDEQQRFGVEQRTLLRQKGKNPHVLTMTATPIPRTVALTLYGDLDLSFLDEMPKGRKQVKTWLVPPEKRNGAYNWIEKQIIENKDQVFIICPLIEESENMISVKAATKEFERLKSQVFPNLKLELLHGKMKSEKKEKILNDFKNKKYDILVSTPVVEVGIDIKNATIMMIEESQKYGLAQLHQLRGRVGRGDKQSYCLLFTDSKIPETLQRLKSMETIYFGPQLAELDLKLRGPGQIYGKLQHGREVFKVADFSDFNLIKKAKDEAEKFFPKIEKYPQLLQKINELNLELVSPD